MTPAQGLGFHRPGILHPAEMIDVMDVKIAETTAAGPEETMKILNLPQQLAGLAWPLRRKG